MTYTQLIDKYKKQGIKLTQKKLAKDTGIPIRTIQGWAAAYRTPPQYIIQMIDKLLETKYLHSIKKNDIIDEWETKKGERIEWTRIEEIEEELDEIEEWIDIILNFEPERNIKMRIDQIPKNIAKIRKLLEI